MQFWYWKIGIVNTKFRLLPIVLACVGLLVLFSVGSMLILHIHTTKSIVSDLIGRSVIQNLNGLELALRTHLDPAKYEADFIAESIQSGDISMMDRKRLADYARGSFAAAPQINTLVISGSDNSAILATRTLGEVKTEWITQGGNARLERMAREMKSRKTPFWGPPIFSTRHNETLLNLRMPIWKDSIYLGFVAIGISTQALSQLALELSEPPRSTVFVLYGQDSVLAHMFLALQPQGLSADKPLLSRNEIIDPVIERLEEAEPFREIGFELPEGTGILELKSAGVRYLAITKVLTGYGNVDFLIGAYSVASAVDAPFRTMFRATVIGVGLLVVALLLSMVLSRIVTRPIRDTSVSVAAVAKLDFEQVPPLPGSQIKEIDDLSSSFNSMLVGLKSFGRYVPRTLVNRLIRENRVGAGTEELDLTVMFTDIVGFTSICEGMSAPEVANFINQHITMVSRCIEEEEGTIDKYIGDAVMAFWGAPDRINDAPVRGVRAALAIQAALTSDNEKRVSMGLSPVRMRIGIHSGPLIVGDIGAPNRINYTVVGDVVNAAQRLEALGKEIDPNVDSIILISGDTKNGLDESFKPQKVGRFKVKGKRNEIEVFRILA
jgi:adenylate cyclase